MVMATSGEPLMRPHNSEGGTRNFGDPDSSEGASYLRHFQPRGRARHGHGHVWGAPNATPQFLFRFFLDNSEGRTRNFGDPDNSERDHRSYLRHFQPRGRARNGHGHVRGTTNAAPQFLFRFFLGGHGHDGAAAAPQGISALQRRGAGCAARGTRWTSLALQKKKTSTTLG
jgi:hypothetical protein